MEWKASILAPCLPSYLEVHLDTAHDASVPLQERESDPLNP